MTHSHAHPPSTPAMTSRRYSLPSFRSAVNVSFRRKAVREDVVDGSGFPTRSLGLDRLDARVQHVKRIMNSVHPGHCRQLPGHSHLHLIFGHRRVDRLALKIDCDEVYPGVLIGNE